MRAIATAGTRQRHSPSSRTLILAASQLGRRSTLWVSIPRHIFPQRRIFTAITDITTRARPIWTRLSMRQRQRVSLQRLRSNWDRQPERKSVVEGKSVSERVNRGGGRTIQQKKK